MSDYEKLRLQFSALEYGDEPHEPPAGPFGNDVNFDGVASYEVQGLRDLRSDRFTAFDIDLDAAMAALGVTHNGSLHVRFHQ